MHERPVLRRPVQRWSGRALTSLCKTTNPIPYVQLGEEAAAAGISGDQLQAALELAARVPLRVVAFADADAEEPASAKVRPTQLGSNVQGHAQ